MLRKTLESLAVFYLLAPLILVLAIGIALGYFTGAFRAALVGWGWPPLQSATTQSQQSLTPVHQSTYSPQTITVPAPTTEMQEFFLDLHFYKNQHDVGGIEYSEHSHPKRFQLPLDILGPKLLSQLKDATEAEINRPVTLGRVVDDVEGVEFLLTSNNLAIDRAKVRFRGTVNGEPLAPSGKQCYAIVEIGTVDETDPDALVKMFRAKLQEKHGKPDRGEIRRYNISFDRLNTR